MILLPASAYLRDAPEVARALIGCCLMSRVGNVLTGGRIVETEAYGKDDPASHAYTGPTPRNAAMFGPPGTAYIYRSYGVHWCLNAVTGPTGTGEAVLIRAIEPLFGLDTMAERRNTHDVRRLCSGPGKLCAALGITGDLNGTSLNGPELAICEADRPVGEVAAAQRIGISRAQDRFWRFMELGSRFVSRPIQIAVRANDD